MKCIYLVAVLLAGCAARGPRAAEPVKDLSVFQLSAVTEWVGARCVTRVTYRDGSTFDTPRPVAVCEAAEIWIAADAARVQKGSLGALPPDAVRPPKP